MSSLITTNITQLQQRISLACQHVQRDQRHILLLAVSKTRSAAMIRQAAATGIGDFGENYLQEALEKQPQLADLALCWHFIGPIQANKTRAIAEHFDWVHSVDRIKIAQRLNDQRPTALAPLNICLQVNISQEESKAGVTVEQLPALIEQVLAMPRLRLRGLMAIPKATTDPVLQRQAFAALYQTWQPLQQRHQGIDTLSMGMSADLEAAIAEGSNLIRIGTDIFGPRTVSPKT